MRQRELLSPIDTLLHIPLLFCTHLETLKDLLGAADDTLRGFLDEIRRNHPPSGDELQSSRARKGHVTMVPMIGLLLGAQVLVLLALAAVSTWGWKHLAPETRVQARAGTTGLDFTMSKTTALVSTPLMGLLVVIATVVVALPDPTNRNTVALLGFGVMVIFLAAHWLSVKRAAR